MPEEILTTSPTQVVTTESNVAPNLDSELDIALSKSFKNQSQEKSESEKKPEKAQKNPEQTEIKIDLKKPSKETNSELKKEDKPIEEEKPLPHPESLDEHPKGKDAQASWTALKNNNKRWVKSNEEKDQEIAKLKSSLAEKSTVSTKEVEALKSQIDELSRYRAMVDIQADPEFVSKFDQPISKITDSIKELFKTVRDKQTGQAISDDIINSIDFTNTPVVDSILDHISNNGDKTTAKRIQRKIEELADLADKRNETLSEQKKNYKELLENKKKESFSKEAEGEGRMIKHLENIALGKDRDGNQKYASIPFLNKMMAKEGAAQPEVDQINNHNRMVDLMHEKIRDGMKMNSPEDKAELIVAAVASHYAMAQVKALTNENNTLKEQIKKISASSSETEKGRVPTTRNGNGQYVDLDSSLGNFFAKR